MVKRLVVGAHYGLRDWAVQRVTAGIITVEDLFEEVVGDIGEDALEEPEIQRVSDGCVRALGTARVENVGEALGVQLEHEDVDTVSGLVLALLGGPPQLGDRVRHEEVELEVTGVYGHGVASALVRRVTPLVDGAAEDAGP